MKTTTKVDNGNDSRKGMSPALTQEHGQDVDETLNSDGYHGVAKLKPVTIKNDWPTHSGGETDNFKENGDSTKSLSNDKTFTHPVDPTSSNGKSVIHSNSDNESNDVSSRIAQSADSSTNMTYGNVNNLNNNDDVDDTLAAASSTKNGLSHGISSKVDSEEHDVQPTTMEPPAIINLHERHKKLVDDARLLVSRIQHLQSMVVTRHTRHQLMVLVEHHHKCLSEQSKVKQDTVQHVNGIGNSYYNSTTTGAGDLSTMSTSALVELVQRMQTKAPVQSARSDLSRATLFMSSTDRTRVQEAAGVMNSTLTHLHSDIDSDATASSSGGETDDEDTSIVDLSSKLDSKNLLRTKACWRWCRDRSQIVSRWTWLQAQVSDLEYKIRQHGDLHRQLRSIKNPIMQPTGSYGLVAEDSSMRAARCIPYHNTQGRRHKTVRISSASSLGPKGNKVIMMPCQCAQSGRQCAICAGHHNYFKPMDIHTYSRNERTGQVDKTFHPVLSFTRDIEPAVELEEIVNSSQHKHSSVSSRKLLKAGKKNNTELLAKRSLEKLKDFPKEMRKNKIAKKRVLADDVHLQSGQKPLRPKKRKYNKRIKSSALRARSSSFPDWSGDDNIVTEETSLSASAPVGELKQTSSNQKKHHYDIDDIVIPYHIAAATRVEKLQYKEIDTPRWRELVVGGSSVHDTNRNSISMPSTPMTPVTPSSACATTPDKPDKAVIDQPTAPCCGPTEPVPLASSKSSSNSLQELEVDEDVSDVKYTERHLKMEENEKLRYMNFVTLGRRPRAQSAVVNPTQARPSESVTSTPAISASAESTSTHRPLTQSNSIPLASSHDTTPLKDDLLPAHRSRSNSFAAHTTVLASRPRKDQSVDVVESVPVFPWPARQFPLTSEDALTLDPNWKPPKVEQVVEQPVAGSDQWKVVSPEETRDQGPSLVLKLSKA